MYDEDIKLEKMTRRVLREMTEEETCILDEEDEALERLTEQILEEMEEEMEE